MRAENLYDAVIPMWQAGQAGQAGQFSQSLALGDERTARDRGRRQRRRQLIAEVGDALRVDPVACSSGTLASS
jgi:hypothetical protein